MRFGSAEGIESRIRAMTDAMLHRGPDAGDCWVHPDGVGLGHRRLKILDLSDLANQPMQDATGRYTVVFNGEIYNYRELRAQLDYAFRTSTDTEVILAAVVLHGLEWLLERAVGMFAIGLYDAEAKVLHLVRDRFGVKPLWFACEGGWTLFASEPKGLFASGLVLPDLDPATIDVYLAARFVPAPLSLFLHVRQIEPGTWISFSADGSNKVRRYWTLPEASVLDGDPLERDVEALSSRVEAELQRAVSIRMLADVRVGTYLSGGLDSSLVTALAAAGHPGIDTFTIGFPLEGCHEFDPADLAARHCHTTHHAISMNQDGYFNAWEDLISIKDAPLGVPNEIPLAIMSKCLKERITVVISGEGADELFSGYGRIFRLPHHHYAGKIPNRSDRSLFAAFLGEYEYVPRALRDRTLAGPSHHRDGWEALAWGHMEGRTPEAGIQRFFQGLHLQGLLQRLDATTMSASVEGRVPFLDHLLVETVLNEVPFGLKLRWNHPEASAEALALTPQEYSEILDTPKFLLKRIAEKHLPAGLVYRKKVGFPVPLDPWWPRLVSMAQDLLPAAPWLEKNSLPVLLGAAHKGGRPGQVLWMYLNYELFRRQYTGRGFGSASASGGGV